MIKWESVGKTELKLLEAIRILFSQHPYLLEFLFDPLEPKLRLAPEELLEDGYGLSSGEDVLVRVGMDIWSGSGDARIWELMEILDDQNMKNVLLALEYLGTKFNGWNGPVMR
jgi:hypothetical protein